MNANLITSNNSLFQFILPNQIMTDLDISHSELAKSIINQKIIYISPRWPPWELPNPLLDQPDLLNLVNQGEAVLWINYIAESYFSREPKETFSAIQQWINESQIPPEKVYYTNGDHKSVIQFKRWKKETCSKHTYNVLPPPFNYWEVETFNLIKKNPTPPWSPALPFKAHFLNFKPKFHRLALAVELNQANLLQELIFSFVKSPKEKCLLWTLETNKEGFSRGFIESRLPDIQKFIEKLPIIYDVAGTPKNIGLPFSIENEARDLHSFLFGISTESEVTPDCLFLTEKTYRHIFTSFPAIFLSYPQSLTHLHADGYQTFESIIDESYDDIYEPEKRITKIVEIVSELTSFPEDRIEEIKKTMGEIKKHNHIVYCNRLQLMKKQLLEFIQQLSCQSN